MKNFIILISAYFFMGPTFGQVTEGEALISLGTHNAFVTEHVGATKKMVNKILENAIKDFGKVKRNKKAKEWNCLQCRVPGMVGLANIYFTIKEEKGQTTSYVFVDDGTQFINSENDAAAANSIKTTLTNIGYDITRAVIANELDDEEDKLKDRNKELKKLEKKNQDYHNDIKKYRQKIAEAEKNIEQNLIDQEDKNMEIEKQIKTVEKVTTKLNDVGKN